MDSTHSNSRVCLRDFTQKTVMVRSQRHKQILVWKLTRLMVEKVTYEVLSHGKLSFLIKLQWIYRSRYFVFPSRRLVRVQEGCNLAGLFPSVLQVCPGVESLPLTHKHSVCCLKPLGDELNEGGCGSVRGERKVVSTEGHSHCQGWS